MAQVGNHQNEGAGIAQLRGAGFPVVATVVGALSLSIEFLGVIVVEEKCDVSEYVAF
jgi:hypothetical protein